MSEEVQLCTFYADEFLFGIEVRKVQEVLRLESLTSVPLAPPVVKGLMNLRGQIVTAVDLRRRLELPDREEQDGAPVSIVVRRQGGVVSLIVDEIGDVLNVKTEDMEPPPKTVTGVAAELVIGAFKLPERLLLLLDAEEVATFAAPGMEVG